MNAIDGILKSINDLAKRVGRLEVQDAPRWVYLAAPLTSASWDWDAYSTTAKTVIDLSAVFSAPAGIKAILVLLAANDSGSAANFAWLGVSPNDTAGSVAVLCSTQGVANDGIASNSGVCPCSATGDIYYQIAASGASTLDAYMQIWGYAI
jgi:hypothetical protein